MTSTPSDKAILPAGAAALYRSQRIAIRTVVLEDLPTLWSAIGEEGFDRFWPAPRPESLDALKQRFQWLQALDSPLEINAIACAAGSDRPFAWLKLTGIDRFHRKGELSIYVHRLRGTRASVEAVGAAIELSLLQLDKLVAHTLPDNLQAQAMLERYGFREEGRLRKEIVLRDGVRSDILRYGLMREDWLQHPLRAKVAEGIATT